MVCDIVQDSFPSLAVDTVTQVVARIRKIGLSAVSLCPWDRAAEEGKRGDSCENNYIIFTARTFSTTRN